MSQGDDSLLLKYDIKKAFLKEKSSLSIFAKKNSKKCGWQMMIKRVKVTAKEALNCLITTLKYKNKVWGLNEKMGT